MKKFVKISRMVVLSMLVSLVFQLATPILPFTEITAQAATKKSIRLNATKKTLYVGDSLQLKLSGTTKKATWSSSKKSVATVNKNGKVVAKAIGKATITAKLNQKSYTCKVTVKAAQNSLVKDAPFDAKEVTFGTYKGVIPKSWDISNETVMGNNVFLFAPSDADKTKGFSNITVISYKTGAEQKSYDVYKEAMETQVTQEYVEKLLSSSLGLDITIQNFNTETKKSSSYNYDTFAYDVLLNGKVVMHQTIYYLFADGYSTEITMTDNQSENTPAVSDIFDYLIKSFTFKK